MRGEHFFFSRVVFILEVRLTGKQCWIHETCIVFVPNPPHGRLLKFHLIHITTQIYQVPECECGFTHSKVQHLEKNKKIKLFKSSYSYF